MADNELDIELIMALAEGRLPPDEAAAAEARLNAEERRELEAQRAALAAMATMEAARLTDAERASLRSSVREAIHLAPAPAARHAAAPAVRRPWFSRLFPALAGVAALILVVGIGLNLGGGGNEEGADFASSETVAATTAATERSADEAASMLQSTEAPAETAETAVAAAEAAVAEEEAIATDATGGRAGAGLIATPDEFRFHPVGDIQQNPDQLIDAMLRYEQDAYVGVLPIEVIPVWAERVAARCWGEALAAVPDATALRLAGFGQWGTEGAEFYEFAGATDFVVVAAIRDTCEIVAVEIP